MTAPGRYAASDGSFAKSTGSAAVRGGALIAVAVLIGVALLAWGFDGGEESADVAGETGTAASEESGSGGEETPAAGEEVDDSETTEGDENGEDNGPTEEGSEATETAVVEVDPPSSVTVAVLNGTVEGGLAGSRSSALGAAGYTVTAGNAADKPVVESKVYYTAGYEDEAKEVVVALSGGGVVLDAAPTDLGALAAETNAADTAAADIVVILGTDEALS